MGSAPCSPRTAPHRPAHVSARRLFPLKNIRAERADKLLFTGGAELVAHRGASSYFPQVTRCAPPCRRAAPRRAGPSRALAFLVPTSERVHYFFSQGNHKIRNGSEPLFDGTGFLSWPRSSALSFGVRYARVPPQLAGVAKFSVRSAAPIFGACRKIGARRVREPQ